MESLVEGMERHGKPDMESLQDEAARASSARQPHCA